MIKVMQLTKIALILAICFINPLSTLAQPGVSPYYKAPTSFAGKTFVVPAGTTFEGRIESTIGSTISKQGSPFIITISSPVLANSSDVLIPAGATILGEVVQAIPAKDVPHAKKQKSVGKLRVQINSLKMPDGMSYPMIASLVGEETIANNRLQAQFGGISNPVRGSGVAYVGTPTGFQSVDPGKAHYNSRTGMSQVVTKNELLNDPIMGRERGMSSEHTAMRSLVKKNRNLFIYNGSPLTIRLEAPLKLGVGSSPAEESALGLHPAEIERPAVNNRTNSFIPSNQQKSNQDSNF